MNAAPSTRVLVVDDSPTIRRVVASVLARAGHAVALAGGLEEGLNALESHRPDLLLLDHTLADTDGLAFLQATHARDTTVAPVPVVLMVTRQDQIGAVPGLKESLHDFGVVDVITKPFSPEALLAVVAHCVDKHVGVRVVPALVSSPDAAALDASDVAGEGARTEIRRGPRGRPLSVSTLRAPLAPPAGNDVDAAVAPAGGAAHLSSSMSRTPPAMHLPDGVALLGDLARVPLAEVMQLLKFQSHTGLLTVETGELAFEVAMDGGAIVALQAHAPPAPHAAAPGQARPPRAGARGDLLLGRYFVAAGLVTHEALERIVATERDLDPRPIGARLVALGLVSPAQLRQAVGEQAQDLMVELLRARRGVFAVRLGRELLPPVVIEPGWLVDMLLFDALRCIDEWAVIEAEVPSFHATFARPGDVRPGDVRPGDVRPGDVRPGDVRPGDVRPAEDDGAAGLSAEEVHVLRLFDAGPLTVREAIKRSARRAFDVCRVLYRLAVLKRLRRVDDGDKRHLVDDDSAPAAPLLSILPREAL